MISNFKLNVIDSDYETIQTYAANIRFRSKFLNRLWTFNIGDLTKQKGDIAVSPANSKGIMKGGIDEAYVDKFGLELQYRVQNTIYADKGGNLKIGDSIIVPTYEEDIPLLLIAPTVVNPGDIANAKDIYLSASSIFKTIYKYNKNISYSEKQLETILLPGLGTGIGMLPAQVSAKEIRNAYIDFRHNAMNNF